MGGWRGGKEQDKRGPGEPGLSKSDKSKGRQQAVCSRLCVCACAYVEGTSQLSGNMRVHPQVRKGLGPKTVY